MVGLAFFLSGVSFLLCHTTTRADQRQKRSNGVSIIPLLPHHAQGARRRLERDDGTSSASIDDNDLTGSRRPYQRYTKSSDLQVASLFQGYGTHYADLWCGTPPQRQTVIVDTGSGVTAFPCDGCKDCGVPKYHIDELFHSDASSSYEVLSCDECMRGHCSGKNTGQCKMGMSYQEGSSWNAVEVRDECYVGGMHEVAVEENDPLHTDDIDPFHAGSFAFPLKFGCQTSLTGLFKTQLADGIMGMDNAQAAFWNQMSVNLPDVGRKFSLCFSRSPTASRQGTNAGGMTLGGFDTRFHTKGEGDMVFTKTDGGSGFYGVRIRQVYLRKDGGESALSDSDDAQVVGLREDTNANPDHAIVDSGTTDTYFSRTWQTAFKKTWKEMTGHDWNHQAIKVTEEELNRLPTILIQLTGEESLNQALADKNKDRTIVGLAGELDPLHPNDVIVAVPPSHFFEYDIRDHTYTSRFYVNEGSSVIGANSMMGHDVFFDVDGKKMGWVESDCDYDSLVEPFLKSGQLKPNPGSSETRQEHKKDPNGTTRNPDDDIAVASNDFCSDAKCKFLLVAAAFGVVVVGLVAMLRRRPTPYSMAPSELELQEAGKSGGVDEESDEFTNVRYRDHPRSNGSFDSGDADNVTPNGSSGAYLEDDAEEGGGVLS